MLIQIDALAASTAPTVYISTLDYEAQKVARSLSEEHESDQKTADTERDLLRKFEWVDDSPHARGDVAFVDALTPKAMHDAVAALSQRITRVSLAVLSGHGNKHDHRILFSDERHEEAPHENGTTWVARLTGNVDVLFLSTCNSASALIDLREMLPEQVRQDIVLVGANNTLYARQAAYAALALQKVTSAGHNLAIDPYKLKLPGSNFGILTPGNKVLQPIESYSKQGMHLSRATDEYLSTLGPI